MNPINTALCSFGMSGWVFHAPFLTNHPGFKLYAVWERSKNLSEESYPGTKVYRTYEELLLHPLIELVIVNTPSYTHFDYAKQALLAGKHVIVEKPFTATVEQAKELVAIAVDQKVKLAVFQNRRYDSDFKTVKDIIQQGVLGDLLEIEFHYDRYNLMLSPKAHKETPGPAVGCIYDLGPHLIDQILHLFNMPKAVFADIMITRPGSLVDDYFEILMYYPKMKVRLKAGYQVREPFASFVVHGSQGSFLKPRADVQEADLQSGRSPAEANWGIEPESGEGLLHTEVDGVVIKKLVPSLPGNYMEYYEGIFKALRQQEAMPVTGEEGVSIITIIEAAKTSHAEGRVVFL